MSDEDLENARRILRVRKEGERSAAAFALIDIAEQLRELVLILGRDT